MKTTRGSAMVLPAILVCSLAAAAPVLAQQRIVRDFPSGGEIRLDLSAGEYRITGSPDDELRVEWATSRADDLARVSVRVDAEAGRATTATAGGPVSGLKAQIQVPRRSDLVVDLTAGELTLRGVEGSKNVSAWAGELDIEVGAPATHRRVDASVRLGELRAPAYAVAKEGIFRSFHASGKGSYDVRADLTVGEIRLAE